MATIKQCSCTDAHLLEVINARINGLPKYQSTHTGAQIDEAITKVENGDLPIASATTLGGVKIGDGISVTEDGTISASGGSSGGTKLYKHVISTTEQITPMSTTIMAISTSSYKINSVIELLNIENGVLFLYGSNMEKAIVNVQLIFGANSLFYIDTTLSIAEFPTDSISTLYDTVTEL